MKFCIEYVIDALAAYRIVPSRQSERSLTSFSRIELFLGQEAESGVLYVIDDGVPAGYDPCQFLVATQHANPTADSLSVIGASAAQAVNCATRHLARLAELLDSMRTCYYERHDLHGFCQLLADFVGNPIIAYDDAIIPVAQTRFPPDLARAILGSDTMTPEYVFKEIPLWMREDSPYPIPLEGFGSSTAFRTETRDKSMSTVMCGIVSDGETRGFLEIFQVSKPVSPGDMRLLEEACRILAVPYPFEDNRFIASHLEGRATQRGLTDAWLSALRWRREDTIFVVVADLPSVYSDSMHNMDRAMRILRSIIPASVCVQMGAIPVLVANSRFSNRQDVVEKVCSFLRDTGTEYHVGASELLGGIGNLHEGYTHAQFAAQYAKRNALASTVAYFENCRFAFFSELCGLEENRDLVVDAAVSQMHADDLVARTDNTLTAKTYIETGFNLNATAQAISVHRNTVAYRLKHIHDRYGIDLSTPVRDTNLVFSILLSCKMLMGDS